MATGRSFLTSFGTRSDNNGISGLRAALKELRRDMAENKKAQKEYSQEIRQAEAEIKAIEKEIRSTGTATDAQRERLDQLRALIENDTNALEQLRVEQARLQTQINDTNAQIKNEQEALKNLKDGMNGAKKAAGELVTEVGAIGAAATAAVAGLFAFTSGAAAWADEVNTLAATTGLGTDEIQKFMYASELIDVDLQTMTGSLSKLTRSMSTASKNAKSDAAAAFDKLGVSFKDATGAMRDREEVFYEVIDALGKIENETERNTVAMSVFGKSAEQLNPLIKGGAETLRELGDEAERAGLILSQDALDSLNAFNDKIDLLKSKGAAVKNLLASEMTPALDGLLEVADDLLNEVKRLAESGELKRIAKEVGEGIKSAASALKNIIEFVWKYKEAIAAAVVGMVAFRVSMSIANLVSSLVKVFQALTTATQAQTVAQGTLNTTMAANPIGAVMALVSGLTTAMLTLAGATAQYTEKVNEAYEGARKYTEGIRELNKSYESRLEQADKDTASLKVLKEQYDELRTKTDRSAAENKKLAQVAEQLASKLGIATDELKKQGGAYRDVSKDIETFISKTKEAARTNYYSEMLGEAEVAAQKLRPEVEKSQKAMEEAKTKAEQMKEEYLRTTGKVYDETLALLGEADELFADELTHQVNAAVREADRLTKVYANQAKELIYAEEKTKEAEDALRDYGDTAADTSDVVASLGNLIDSVSSGLEEYQNAVDESTKKQEELAKASADLRGEMNSLTSSLAQLEKGESLSLDTILQLIEKYPEYTSQLIAATDNVDLQKEALKALFEAKKAEYILTQQAAIDNIDASDRETKKMIQNTKIRINLMKQEAAARGNLAAAMGLIMAAIFEISGYEDELAKNAENRGNLQQRIDWVQGLNYEDFVSGKSKSVNTTTGSGSSGGSGSTGKSDSKWTMDSRGVYAEGNSYLDAYTKWMDRAKTVGKLTTDEEIQLLKDLLRSEKLTAEEREQARQRIYSAEEKRRKAAEDAEKDRQKAEEEAEKAKEDARKKEISDYLTWIDRKKSLGELSLQAEIKHLETLAKREDLTADERYNIELRLYNARNELESKRQKSIQERADKEAKAVEEAEQKKREARELSKAALDKLIDDEIAKHEAAANGAKEWADKEIAALDEVARKRKQEQSDKKRQNELDLIDLKLRSGHLSEFEKRELERRKQDILNEQYEEEYEQSIEARKTDIQTQRDNTVSLNQQAINALRNSKTVAADRVAYLNGTQSYDQRVKNNNVTQNVTIVQNGLGGDQLISKILKELGVKT